MNEILLILISGLLITCMAGSAMATDTNLIPNDIVTVYPESDGTVTLNAASFPAGNYDLMLEVYGTGLSASIEDSANIFTLPFATPGVPQQREVSINGDHQATIKIHRDEGTVVGAVKVSIIDKNQLIVTDQVTVSSETVRVNAPEFPTVAAPVAAVLGLLFVFGRKKGGL